MSREASPRLVTIDAVRGFAVLGILLMNIVPMAMPVQASVDPRQYGGAHGANLAAWALAYGLVDGKMRALFTMLFGASIALVADQAARPAVLHYRRMAWLFLFGMAHTWLLWFGDILVLYALVGMIAFIGWRWQPAALCFVVACCFAVAIADDLLAWSQLGALKAAAAAPDAPDAVTAAWNRVRAFASPPPAALAREIALYRGGFLDALAARAPTTRTFQTIALPLAFPETLGYAALGLALHRLGFFAGRWRPAAYRALIATGLIAILLYWPLVQMLIAARFDPATMPLADLLSFLLRPWLALAYAAAIILLVQSGRLRRLVERLAATGRMALSNYIGSSLVATTIFYGYGLGLYGRIDRAALYCILAIIWAIILIRSPAWLDRFAYGPLEWLWRALSRQTMPTFRKIAIATYSHQR